MKIWVTGHHGMLGEAVLNAALSLGKHEVAVTSRSLDIGDHACVEQFIQDESPDVIINCAGRREGSAALMIAANGLGPHVLASFGIPMVHMSTDCVFGGHTLPERQRCHPQDTHWSSAETPVPGVDLYGRSKLLGEVEAPHVLNVRGSFIGPRHGLLRWLLDTRGMIDVWKHAYWNGTYVTTMAERLVAFAEAKASDVTLPAPFSQNVVHLASEQFITKAKLAQLIVEGLNLPVSLNFVDEPEVWRVLRPDVVVPSIEEILAPLLETLVAAH